MGKFVVAFVLASCVAAPAALAQERLAADGQGRDGPGPVALDPPAQMVAQPVAPPHGAARPRSGFGQVMRMLTDLLQEAARQQASATGDGASPPVIAAQNAAVDIRVTPVAGRSSFYAPKAGKQLPASAAASTLDPPPAREAGLAVQAGSAD